MLENHPVLKDRLTACGVFAGIAVGAIAGVEMIIGGGFDIITPGQEIREIAPSAYVTVAPSDWFSTGAVAVTSLASTEPLFAGEAFASEANLDGGANDATAPNRSYAEVDDRALARHVEALYAANGGSAYETTPTSYTPDDADLPEMSEGPTLLDDEFVDAKPDDADLSASETASPW